MVSVKQASQEYGVASRTLYRWIDQGHILAVKKKGRWQIDELSLEHHLGSTSDTEVLGQERVQQLSKMDKDALIKEIANLTIIIERKDREIARLTMPDDVVEPVTSGLPNECSKPTSAQEDVFEPEIVPETAEPEEFLPPMVIEQPKGSDCGLRRTYTINGVFGFEGYQQTATMISAECLRVAKDRGRVKRKTRRKDVSNLGKMVILLAMYIVFFAIVL